MRLVWEKAEEITVGNILRDAVGDRALAANQGVVNVCLGLLGC